MAHPLPIERRALVGALAAMVPRPTPAAARGRYVFDETRGRLEFTARHLGFLSSTGRFEDFAAELLIDPNRPLTSLVTVTVRTAAIALAYPGAVDLLRSADFFDVERFPEARFTGAATGQGSLENFALAGELTIRGITRPYAMEARLVGRRRDAAVGADVADFAATGAMRRSEYGMTAQTTAISDTIRLAVSVSLIV